MSNKDYGELVKGKVYCLVVKEGEAVKRLKFIDINLKNRAIVYDLDTKGYSDYSLSYFKKLVAIQSVEEPKTAPKKSAKKQKFDEIIARLKGLNELQRERCEIIIDKDPLFLAEQFSEIAASSTVDKDELNELLDEYKTVLDIISA